MVELNFVTTNKNKIKEYSYYFGDQIKIKQIDFDYPEKRFETNREIAAFAAKELAEKYKKPVVVDDTGIFIEALNGFPGIVSAYVAKRIGNKGLLKLMEGKENRELVYRVALAYCKPNESPKVFEGEEKGILAKKEKGSKGWGTDPIFIPLEIENPEKKTYAELRNDEKPFKLFRERAALKLKDFLI